MTSHESYVQGLIKKYHDTSIEHMEMELRMAEIYPDPDKLNEYMEIQNEIQAAVEEIETLMRRIECFNRKIFFLKKDLDQMNRLNIFV